MVCKVNRFLMQTQYNFNALSIYLQCISNRKLFESYWGRLSDIGEWTELAGQVIKECIAHIFADALVNILQTEMHWGSMGTSVEYK